MPIVNSSMDAHGVLGVLLLQRPRSTSGPQENQEQEDLHAWCVRLWLATDPTDTSEIFRSAMKIIGTRRHVDALSESDHAILMEVCTKLVRNTQTVPKPCVIEVAEHFPEILPVLLDHGADPQTTVDRDGVAFGILDLASTHATRLQDAWGMDRVHGLFAELLRRGVYPNPAFSNRVEPPLCALIYDTEQNPWLIDIIGRGLAIDAREANLLVMVAAHMKKPAYPVIELSLAAGARLDHVHTDSTGMELTAIEAARNHQSAWVRDYFETAYAKQVAASLSEATPQAASGPKRRI